MIVLYHPRATRPRNRRFPLSILSLAAVLEEHEEYVIVDGNADANETETLLEILGSEKVELIVTISDELTIMSKFSARITFAVTFVDSPKQD